ncbi:MAG TPA: acyl-CoA dehydrogenase family protein [Acidimicrobiales bacterium]|nr:acyl-CoA dehydrogenase family protein [Acidimicrobiales bacterium]|tara:strand:- start:119 stop:1345 length:1227 start_codon:yes stop_codon:yes gene_type:complete
MNSEVKYSENSTDDVFRLEVEDFFSKAGSEIGAIAEGIGDADTTALGRAKSFQLALSKAGLAGITYSKEYGGAGLTDKQQEIFSEVASGWDSPTSPFSISHGMCLPMLNQFGTHEQKLQFMPDNISGKTIWCQLFSEPGAGSDVASLSTRAVLDGDEWIINGQKVWTSGAHYCDYGIVVARTDPSLPKHRGLTMFIIDMADSAIDVRPLKQISGGKGFNEIFFTDLRIPVDYQLGELNQGWNLAVSMLMFERVSIGASAGGLNADRSSDLIKLAQNNGRSKDPVMRQKLADLWIRERIKSFIGQRIRDAVSAGQIPGPEGSIAKLNGALLARIIRDTSIDLVKTQAQAWETEDLDGNQWAVGCLAAAGISIAGGTDEVQRNIIGERVLGLPKEPDPFKGAAWEDVPRS